MQYSTGTLATAAGSNVITGTGTSWLTNAVPGDMLLIGNDTAFFTIAAVISDTVLWLSANYPITRTNQTYTISRDFTPNVELPLVNMGDLRFDAVYSRAMKIIDGLLQGGFTFLGVVVDRHLDDAPASGLLDGDRYIVASPAASGEWYGYDDYVAEYDDSVSGGQWSFYQPQLGDIIGIEDEGIFVVWSGTAWVPIALTAAALHGIHNADFLGMLAAATGASNYPWHQAKLYFPHGGTITGLELKNVDGLYGSSGASPTIFRISDNDYSQPSGSDGFTLSVEWSEHTGLALGSLVIPVGGYAYVFLDQATGVHMGAHLAVHF